MTTETLSAAADPGLATQLIEKALNDTDQKEQEAVKVKLPSDTLVDLPGGYINANGEVIRSVEVRELTGKDEEIISKSTTIGRLLSTVLSRGTVKVGDEVATEEILNSMFAGDREAILLGIHKVTFGTPVELSGFCRGCDEVKQVAVDVDEDIKVKKLSDPVAERTFKVKGRSHEYTVVLPNGTVQKELQSNLDKTVAELSTILLQACVTEIDGDIVYSKNSVQNMGLVDRRKVSEEIAKRNPGPVFDDITTVCPDCDGEVVIPINLGSLFQF